MFSIFHIIVVHQLAFKYIMLHHVFFSFLSLFGVTLVLISYSLNRLSSRGLHLAEALLLSFLVNDYVGVTVWEGVLASTVLLAITPSTLKALAVWVVQSSRAEHLVMLELPVVDLAVGPVVRASPVLLVALPFSFVDSAVRIHIETSSLHAV